MTIEHHRCHRGDRCARREKHPDLSAVYLGGPINASRGLCDACTRHLRDVLAELPRDYVDLHSALARVAVATLDAVAGTRELPMPLRADIEAHMSLLAHELQCWAESTSEVLGVYLDTQHARDARPGMVVQRCSRILAEAVPVLLALRDVEHLEHTGLVDGHATAADVLTRDGLDGAVCLIDLHHRIRATLGRTDKLDHLPERCAHCGRKALTHPDGSDTVTCEGCNARYTWDDYLDRCTVLLADRVAG